MHVPRSEPPEFTGFAPEAFDFFNQLSANNHKVWFHDNRDQYEQYITGALKGLFESLVPTILELSPNFEVNGRTGKNLSRINRDMRFARDKSPYRHNLYLYFTERENPGRDARLYVGLSADGVTCGFATYHRPHGAMDKLLKQRRARHPQAVDEFCRRISRRYEMYWHGTERRERVKYSGPPKSDKDWKRCKGFVVRKLFSPQHKALGSRRFVGSVEKIFRELFPLYAFSALEGPENEKSLD